MSEMFDRAMERLRDETAKAKNPEFQAVGEMVTNHLRAHPEWAGAIAASDKGLKGLYDAMYAQARKKARGGSYYMPPSEEAECVRAYYGISDEAQTPADVDAFDLEALLGL